jgi:hypothetical protein
MTDRDVNGIGNIAQHCRSRRGLRRPGSVGLAARLAL